MIYSVDTNHKEIVGGLRAAGFTVMDNADSGSGRLDIITSKRGFHTVCIEIKFGDAAVFKRSQLKFLSEWAGLCGYVKDFQSALNLAREPQRYALTEQQQHAIKVWLYKNPTVEQVIVSTFEREAFGIDRKKAMKKSHHYDVYIVTVAGVNDTKKVFSHIEKLQSKPSKKALDQIKFDVKQARRLKPNQTVEIVPSSRM